jgi:pre-mRNA-splicing factor ATP-dependent RNA helicase DHX16
LIRALEQLYALGALNDRGELTKLGRRMAEFPMDPMMAKCLIASEKYMCSSEVLTILSMLSIGSSVFYRPKDKAVHADNAKMNFARGGGGDHMALMRCYNEWVDTNYSTQWCYENYVQVRSMNKARDIREQIEGLMERVEVEMASNPHDTDAVCKALTAGYFYNIAKLSKNGDFKTIKHQHTVYIHPSSVLSREEDPPRWLLYHELAFTSKEYMRMVTPIKGEWLIEIAPHYYQPTDIEDSTTKKMPKNTGTANTRTV